MIRVKICLKIWCKMNLKAKIILPKDYDHMPSHWQQPSLAPAPTSSRRTRPQPNTPLQWQPLTSPSLPISKFHYLIRPTKFMTVKLEH